MAIIDPTITKNRLEIANLNSKKTLRNIWCNFTFTLVLPF